MPSLFSMPTPEQVRQEARNRLFSTNVQMAQLSPGQQIAAAAGQAGSLFGEAIGRGMGGSLPEEQKAQRFQAAQAKITSMSQNLNLSDPNDFIEMTGIASEVFNEMGLPDFAQQAALQGLEVRKQFAGKAKDDSLFAKLQNPEKFTPESLAVFERTGKFSDLRTKPEKVTSKLSVGDTAVDKAFAKEYVDWTTGGYADVEKNLLQLRSVKERLDSGEELTGPVTGTVPDFLRKFSNPDSLTVRDEVEEVVQRNLRLILGAQFTQKEGERLIARAYNENLDEATNSKRVGRLIDAIEKAAIAKQSAVDYFKENETLKGFRGKQFSLSDIEQMIEEESPDKKQKGEKQKMSDEEYNAKKRMLGL